MPAFNTWRKRASTAERCLVGLTPKLEKAERQEEMWGWLEMGAEANLPLTASS